MSRTFVLLLVTSLAGCPGSTRPEADGGADAEVDAGPDCGVPECTAVLPTPIRFVSAEVHENTWGDRTGTPLDLPTFDPVFGEPEVGVVIEASRAAIPAHAAEILAGCERLRSCVLDELGRTAEALLRRGLSEDERAAIDAGVPSLEPEEGERALEVLLWQMRLWPETWLVIERGHSDERAARLAFALWLAAPDATLRGLLAEDDVESAVDLALGDARAARGWVAFHRTLLKAESDHPTLGDRPARETELYLRAVLAPETTLDALLRSPFTFADDTLAAHYGFDARPGPELVRVDAPARYNLLTHASLLGSAPTARGAAVLDAFFCAPTLPFPEIDPDSIPVSMEPTRRARLDEIVRDPECRTCHDLMDPMGYALEAYGAEGEYRPVENGTPVDTSFALGEGCSAVAGDGPDDLVTQLLAQPRVLRCYARKWARWSLDGPVPTSRVDCVPEIDADVTVHEVMTVLTRLPTDEPSRVVPPLRFAPIGPDDDPIVVAIDHAIDAARALELDAEERRAADLLLHGLFEVQRRFSS